MRNFVRRPIIALFLFQAVVLGFPGGDGEPTVDPVWKDWITANHYPIASISPGMNDFSDLQFLKPLIGERRLVQLGESGHGVSEFNQAKVRLIKFLHEEMNFDVIAFESGLFECFQADAQADSLTAKLMMRNSIFSVWHCEETLELFRYIKETKSTDHPLILAGFDVQRSSVNGSATRPELFKNMIGGFGLSLDDDVYYRDKEFLAHLSDPVWLNKYGNQYKDFYLWMYGFMNAHMDKLIENNPRNPRLPLILARTAWSMVPFINELTTSGWTSSNYRDRGMADNIGFLAEKVYPGKKIMIWAHNAHIRYADPVSSNPDEYTRMGEWLIQRYRPELYSVGLFMYEGEAAWNDRTIYQITPALANSLEAVFYYTGTDYSFVDMLNCPSSAGCSWMDLDIDYKAWGYFDDRQIPRREYDAILFIKTVHPPRYITSYAAPSQMAAPNPDFWIR